MTTTGTDDLLDEVRRLRRLTDPRHAKDVRLRAGLTQARVAVALGVERTTLMRWEAGTTRPRDAQREAWADLVERLELETT